MLAYSPVSMVIMHVWSIGLRVHSGEFAGKNKVRPHFLLPGFFCSVEILGLGLGSYLVASACCP